MEPLSAFLEIRYSDAAVHVLPIDRAYWLALRQWYQKNRFLAEETIQHVGQVTHLGEIYNNQLNDYDGYHKDKDNKDTTDEGNILQSNWREPLAFV